MPKEFTVLVSSTNEMTVNEIGELLNLIETRGIVIEEIHPENVIATDYEMEERDVTNMTDTPCTCRPDTSDEASSCPIHGDEPLAGIEVHE